MNLQFQYEFLPCFKPNHSLFLADMFYWMLPKTDTSVYTVTGHIPRCSTQVLDERIQQLPSLTHHSSPYFHHAQI